MNTIHRIQLALLCCAALGNAPAFADTNSYSLTASTTPGGGGTGVGNTYIIKGSIGQPDAGEPLRGNGYTVTGGLWSFFSVVSMPGAPTLKIKRPAPSEVIVAWPAPSDGWVLEQTSVLAPKPELTVWTAADLPPVVVIGAENTVRFAPAVGIRYFRLRRP